MAKILPNTDVFAVRDAIREWVDLLAANRYDLAVEFLSPIPDRAIEYDAESIRDAIGSYNRNYRDAPPGERNHFLPRVCAPLETSGENMVIYYTGRHEWLTVEYDLPLDGEWSDLTAKFRIVNLNDGFRIGLLDIHVL